MLRYFKY